uniref:Cadherin domain-containing protein n=1 Tax=Amphiprion ocellaris TaxID=80972 RepID=A0AAQ5ZD85_AMPOC
MNAELHYSLYGPSSDLFSIDPYSGTVFTSSVLQRMDDIIVNVHVEDGGEDRKFDTTTISIRFQDEFWVNASSGEIYTKQPLMLHNSAFEISQFTVVAFDCGIVPTFSNTTVIVRLEQYNHHPPVFLPVQPLIAVPYHLPTLADAENLFLTLFNHGVITGMDVDETLVYVSVTDTNDPPVFTPTSYIANITEDSPAGTSVVTVSALDQDSILDWNRFFFSIENGNTNFSFAIDPSSGLISVNSPLDRELWPVYNLTVTATDNGSPPATGTTTVIVTIGDVNDNAPKLTTTGAQVKENQPEGTVVTRLNASDSDLPPNQGPFTYSLLNRSTGFLLTPDGLLLTTQTIDREQLFIVSLSGGLET